MIHSKSTKSKKGHENWTRVVQKNLRQAGNSYEDSRGKIVKKAEMRECCNTSCSKKCSTKFSEAHRRVLFNNFWTLSDEQKRFYYGHNIIAFKKKQATSGLDSRRIWSREYSFLQNNERIVVCQTFFLNTLGINKDRIDYYFKCLGKNANEAFSLKWGKHVKQKLSQESVQEAKRHIASFPTMESHYARNDSDKLYLQPGLTLSKMHELYLEAGNTKLCFNSYATIFRSFFKLSFVLPKKDVCPECTKKAENLLSAADLAKFEIHVKEKELARTEKHRDNDSCNDKALLVSVDMANVFLLPKTNIGPLFYKRKLTVYNYTGRVNRKMTTFVTYDEGISGRKGDDVASCMYKLLEDVVNANPEADSITIWSDSCISQNKNQMSSSAILYFMKKNPKIKIIHQKYSEPHHSTIQEIDTMHSKIEKKTKHVNVFSPIDYEENLKLINNNKTPAKVIKMEKNDFLLFQNSFSHLNFTAVPYTKIKHIVYDGSMAIKYRTSFSQEGFVEVNLIKGKTTRAKQSTNQMFVPDTVSAKKKTEQISKEKKGDIKYALQFMPEVHKNFYTEMFASETSNQNPEIEPAKKTSYKRKTVCNPEKEKDLKKLKIDTTVVISKTI